jgi:dTDP-4-amino-4,6-dideoxygalactose transaminase
VRDRTRVFKALRDKGIGVQVNYVPANHHPVFTKLGYKPQNLPNSEKFYSQEISLPIYKGLSRSTLDKIVMSVVESL